MSRDDLAAEIVRLLVRSGLSIDEQMKALAIARAEAIRPLQAARPKQFPGPLAKPGKNRKEREK